MRSNFDYTKQENVDQVMGAAFLIRNDLIGSVGLLDDKFWVWFEEVDYCKRVKQANWEIAYTPNAEVMHYGGVSFNQLVSWKKTWSWLMSMMHYANKYFSLFEQIILWLLLPLALILSLPSSLIHLVVRRRNKKLL